MRYETIRTLESFDFVTSLDNAFTYTCPRLVYHGLKTLTSYRAFDLYYFPSLLYQFQPQFILKVWLRLMHIFQFGFWGLVMIFKVCYNKWLQCCLVVDNRVIRKKIKNTSRTFFIQFFSLIRHFPFGLIINHREGLHYYFINSSLIVSFASANFTILSKPSLLKEA